MKDILLTIDFDDTMVISAVHFWENYANVLSYFYQQLELQQVNEPTIVAPTIAEALRILETYEAEYLPEYGYTATRMTKTFRRVFETFGIEVTEEQLAKFRSFANSPFDQPVTIFPGVKEGLEALSEFSRMVIWTRGNHDVQMKRIQRCGLLKYFECVYAFNDKNATRLKEVIEAETEIEQEVWMIGNSIEHDIMPAVEVGINAILISRSPGGMSWFRNFQVVESFPKAVEIITGKRSERTMKEMFR